VTRTLAPAAFAPAGKLSHAYCGLLPAAALKADKCSSIMCVEEVSVTGLNANGEAGIAKLLRIRTRPVGGIARRILQSNHRSNSSRLRRS
jgi:hypothetical protein